MNRHRINFMSWIRRPSTWLVLILAVFIGMTFARVQRESSDRTQELRDVVCGVYVPIGNAHLPAYTSPLGRTIVVATRHGALRIHCPGIK